jgi:hypothetical protein
MPITYWSDAAVPVVPGALAAAERMSRGEDGRVRPDLLSGALYRLLPPHLAERAESAASLALPFADGPDAVILSPHAFDVCPTCLGVRCGGARRRHPLASALADESWVRGRREAGWCDQRLGAFLRLPEGRVPGTQARPGGDAPLGVFDRLAIALHRAWAAPEQGRAVALQQALVALFTAPLAHAMIEPAWLLLHAQPEAPREYVPPPETARFVACALCARRSGLPHRAPRDGNDDLWRLRDPLWLGNRLARGDSAAAIGRRLGCDGRTVLYWAGKHQLRGAVEAHPAGESVAGQVREMHRAGRGPGGIARELRRGGSRLSARQVRALLTREGIVQRETEHVYARAAWWRQRLREPGASIATVAREAGLDTAEAGRMLHRLGVVPPGRRREGGLSRSTLARRLRERGPG